LGLIKIKFVCSLKKVLVSVFYRMSLFLSEKKYGEVEAKETK